MVNNRAGNQISKRQISKRQISKRQISKLHANKRHNDLGAAASKLVIVLVIAFGIAAVLACVFASTSESTRTLWIGENGIIESLSAVLYLIVAFSLVITGIRQFLQTRQLNHRVNIQHPWLLAALTTCFAARELDFHSRFTGGSVLKTSYYLNQEIGVLAKGIPLIILTLIAGILAILAARYYVITIRRLRDGNLIGVMVVAAAALVVVSKGTDIGLGSLRRNGLVPSESIQNLASGFEEVSEVFIPCSFLAMFVMALKTRTLPRDAPIEQTSQGNSTETKNVRELPLAA